jgi:phospholipase/carboxylesterase
MTTKLSGPMVPPKQGGAPTEAVVLLHGYGSDGQDLIGLAQYWRDLLPGAVFIAPNAPEPCRDNFGGYQWYPIDYSRPEARFEGAEAARPVIIAFLADLWAQTGLGPENTLLGGFSQGAMMALHVGISLDVALRGVLSFSGALIAPEGFRYGTGPKPPICLVHGDRDEVVHPELSIEASKVLRERGYSVSHYVEIGAGHTIAPDGLAFASRFIAEVMAGA